MKNAEMTLHLPEAILLAKHLPGIGLIDNFHKIYGGLSDERNGRDKGYGLIPPMVWV